MSKSNPYLLGTGIGLASMAVAIFGGYACGDAATQARSGVVETTTTTAGAPGMTFAECQASAEYPGGRYAVEYDNGVCTVQKPADVPAVEVSYANCDEVRAAGKAPLRTGDPGYSSKLDRDGDGAACDS